ncbi:NAD(P)-dependent oxidoreductase, partial [Candidatus Woesearchaeota archaeon CG10_big_fil_rev_8_21_14_0_10_34_8]
DVRDRQAVFSLLDCVKPDIIIQPAAQPWVDFCEKNPCESYAINVQGPYNVIDWCAKNNVKHLFLSTDYIFDGKEGPYTEDAKPNPLNVYGRHKLLVEEYIQRKLPNLGLIVRTVGVYGWEKWGKNFVANLVKNLQLGKEIIVPNDQDATPIHVDDLSNAILALIKNNKHGIYHAAGPKFLSRYEFSLIIADVFECDKSLIKGVETKELGQAADRPRKAGLLTAKIKNEINVNFKDPYLALGLMKEKGNPFAGDNL